MRRVVSAWLPTWPTDRLRRRPGTPPPDRPLVTAVREGAKRLVAAADVAALARGVTPGMPVALAQATSPDLLVVEADPAADAAALNRLAVWALRYTPIVAADAPDGLVLDVAGAAHLAGGEAALMADLTRRLGRNGIAARAALADGWAGAWGLARFAVPGTIAPVGGLEAAVSGLPVEALRIPPDLATALRGVGLDTVGELAAMPRPSLALRFGRLITDRLDAVFGRMPEVIEPALAPELRHARLRFAEPLGHLGALQVALAELAERLCGDLERAGLGARLLDLRLRRVDKKVAILRVGAARATREPAHIARLFAERLPTVDPGFGIEEAVLAAPRVEPFLTHQGLLRDADDPDSNPDFGLMVDRIAARIGQARVYRLVPVESDIPERALRRVPALAPPSGRSWEDGPRPLRLLDPPQPVEVIALLPDHPPAYYVWQGVRRRVVRADAAEAVWGEWWRADGEVYAVREYFRVEDTQGGRVWLFRATGRDGAVRWFIQGVFA